VDSSPHYPHVVVGCSKAETLASPFPATAGINLVQPSGGNGVLVRLGRGDQVEHPVGYLKEQPKAGTAGAREDSPGCCFSAPGMTWFPIPLTV
jgi:hypothetical protein